jgi:hypothetical protein
MPSNTKRPAKRLKKWPKGAKQPIAFMLQPTHYEIVPPERLKEWEELMIKRVGLPPELVTKIAAGGGVGRESFSLQAQGPGLPNLTD